MKELDSWDLIGPDIASATKTGDVVLTESEDAAFGLLVRVPGAPPTFLTAFDKRGVRAVYARHVRGTLSVWRAIT